MLTDARLRERTLACGIRAPRDGIYVNVDPAQVRSNGRYAVLLTAAVAASAGRTTSA